jgi:2-dehydrotetronate isomerase
VIRHLGRDNIKLQFDFYHAQIVGGDLFKRFEACFPVVGHVQIAAVPSRAEPDEGEVNFPAIFAMLDRIGYSGFVGCEYKPRGKTEDGLHGIKAFGLSARR